eukprot:CAMPEP_0170058474 /NCGR_PEP_ID=MMETSP0019_2-20121128/1087_1 /TAXON_ID=98059 /ORGANISM="Dinobryon sp., Strain UTEXLB2267" /LENGTH=327 /DNA_ID=CAMNT_0010263431 /DNA_START=357 /DNA_END=1342 /DNA_ORIENTATION=-
MPSYIQFKKWILHGSTIGNSSFFSDLYDSDSRVITKAVVINGDNDTKRFITCLKTNSKDPRYRDVLHSSFGTRTNMFYLHRDIFEDMNTVFESIERTIEALRAIFDSQSEILALQDTLLANQCIMERTIEVLKEHLDATKHDLKGSSFLKEHQNATKHDLERILTIVEKGESDNDTLHALLELNSGHKKQMLEKSRELEDCSKIVGDCGREIAEIRSDLIPHMETFGEAKEEIFRTFEGGVWTLGVFRVVRGYLETVRNIINTVGVDSDRIRENDEEIDRHLETVGEGMVRVLEDKYRLDEQRNQVAARIGTLKGLDDPERPEEGIG